MTIEDKLNDVLTAQSEFDQLSDAIYSRRFHEEIRKVGVLFGAQTLAAPITGSLSALYLAMGVLMMPEVGCIIGAMNACRDRKEVKKSRALEKNGVLTLDYKIISVDFDNFHPEHQSLLRSLKSELEEVYKARSDLANSKMQVDKLESLAFEGERKTAYTIFKLRKNLFSLWVRGVSHRKKMARTFESGVLATKMYEVIDRVAQYGQEVFASHEEGAILYEEMSLVTGRLMKAAAEFQQLNKEALQKFYPRTEFNELGIPA